jgi:hypothetical protein
MDHLGKLLPECAVAYVRGIAAADLSAVAKNLVSDAKN